MSSSLSEEEFHRMQLQLIELRTTNYELEGKNKKSEREIAALNEKIDNIDKELQKANKAIQKSKKAKEVELLIQENDTIQRKLLSQEDEFRLQNQTLMQELSSLVSSNETLEKELKELQNKKETSLQSSNAELTELEDEVRRLQAQNTALQKNLTASQEKIENLQEQLHRSADKPSVKDDASETNGDSPPLQEDNVAKAVKVEDEMRESEDHSYELSALKLQLDTESEEKRMLKEKLSSVEVEFKEKNIGLQDDIEKTNEKLKKKQESFIQLQEEKEKLFKEANQKQEELQAARDRDQKYYTDQISKLQQEIQRHKQSSEDSQDSKEQTIKNLQSKLQSLQSQVDAVDIVNNQKMREYSAKYEKEMEGLRNKLDSLQQQRDDLQVQLKASKTANQETLDQLYALQQEREGQIQQWQEINKVAEKRKSMLDELANKYQRDSASHQEKLRQIEDEHEAEIKRLEDKLAAERKKVTELEKIKPQFEELKQHAQSMEEAKGWLERRLKETEEQFASFREEKQKELDNTLHNHEKEVAIMKEEYLTEKEQLKEEHTKEINEYIEKEKSLQTQLDDEIQQKDKMKQEIKDGVDERKIHEKKGMKTLKDLKRQLHSEKKRAEKLQEKLQEVLTDTKHNKSVEELLNSSDRHDSFTDDKGSVSSWNTGYSQANTSVVSSPMTPEKTETFLQSPTASAPIQEEHNELLNRLADLQQSKWNLEEKVSHLETSNSAMAEDLIQKTKIIEHYVRDTGSKNDARLHPHQDDKLSLKKVLDLVNKSDEQNLREMNKKLQRMLEETLTKNMHLEQNLEAMSVELVRLSKISPVDTPSKDLGMEAGKAAEASGVSPQTNKLSTNDENGES